MDRRDFLRLASGGLLAACTEPLFAASRSDLWNRPRRLWIKREIRKGVWEEVNEVYFANGKLVKPGYVAICKIMRDVQANVAVQMSPVLFDILYGTQEWLSIKGTHRVIVANSGFRTIKTNKAVGGRDDSRHMEGGAGDIFLPDVSVFDAGHLAQKLKGGGVGFYPSRHFIHVDDGDIRTWTDYT